MATSTDNQYRNGTEAIRYANLQVAQKDSAFARDTLAAALAAAGMFDAAVLEQKLSISMAKKAGTLTNGFISRLKLYQSNEALFCPGGPCD